MNLILNLVGLACTLEACLFYIFTKTLYFSRHKKYMQNALCLAARLPAHIYTSARKEGNILYMYITITLK